MTRVVNEEALDLIKRFEGFHRQLPSGMVAPYLCPANVWTIGWGTTIGLDGNRLTGASSPLTREQCEQLFRRDVQAFAVGVAQSIRVPVTDNQFGALVSFAYNLGVGALRSSTLLRRVNEGRFDAAGSEFSKWVMAGGRRLQGLVLRREAEKALFLKAAPEVAAPAPPSPIADRTNRFLAAFQRGREGIFSTA